jgi:hypothetical protein
MNIKKSTLLRSLLSVLFMFNVTQIYSAQPSNEVQISGPEKELASPQSLEEFQGEQCEFKAKPGCDTRMLCYATEQIIGKSSNSKNMALKRASNKARNAYIKTINKNPVALTEKCHEKASSYTKEVAGGASSGVEQSGSMCDTFTTLSASVQADALEAVATQINMEESEVTVVIGRSCAGAKAANLIRNGADVNSDGSEGLANSESGPLPGKAKSKVYKRNDF